MDSNNETNKSGKQSNDESSDASSNPKFDGSPHVASNQTMEATKKNILAK